MEISNLGKGLPCAVGKLLPQQVRRAMKLTAILLTVVCVNVSAHSFEQQTVSFSGKDVPLTAVFKSIEKQTGFSFFFNYSLLSNSKPVTINVHSVKLEVLLDLILKVQGFDYYQNGKTIFVIKMAHSTSGDSLIGLKKGNIFLNVLKGVVVNSQDEPLAGATIEVVKEGKNILTDAFGKFEIKNAPQGATLKITYLGYQPKVIEVDENESIRIVLELADNKLDEAEVIAYGSTTQRFSTGNITTVKGEDIARQPIQNPLLALEGRVPGLFITQASGIAGTGVTVRLEGQNSISAGNDPLYIIDGVPYPSQMLPTTTGGPLDVLGSSGASARQPGGNGNPLGFINPADIESVNILKDADATAIYGSRAANGAILITTKKGKMGPAKVSLNVQQGEGAISRRLNLLSLRQYLDMRYEGISNDGLSITSSTNYDLRVWDTTRNTNWQRVLLGGTARYTNIYSDVSGGNNTMQYLVGATFNRNSSVFPGNFADQRIGLHFTVNSFSENRKFRLQLSGNYLDDDNRLPGHDLTSVALTTPPDAPSLYNPGGSLNWAPNSSGSSTWFGGSNPVAFTLAPYENHTRNLLGNLILGYKILPGLELTSSFGYTNLGTNESQLNPLIAIQPASRPFALSSANYTNSAINTWIIEPQINYDVFIGKGKLNLLLGSTIQQNHSNGYVLTGSGFSSDALLSDIHSAATIVSNSSVASVYKYDALFGRIGYRLMDRYLVDVTARRDGSSRFGSQNQFHNFGAIGAAWIFSEEHFFKHSVRFLSFGKIHGSYGITGNDQIGDYQYLNLYNTSAVPVPYQGISALTTAGLPNPYLQWETTKKSEIGIDLGLGANSRILLSVNYVVNHSSNELLTYKLPIITGFTAITENFPATIENTGVEINVNCIDIKNKDFFWKTNVNLTLPNNKLVSFPNLKISSYANSLVIGKPITILKVYHSLGVDPTKGEYVFESSHGVTTSSPSPGVDQIAIVNTLPKYYGGFSNSFGYKHFQLDILFQFVKQIGAGYHFGAQVPGERFNQPKSVLGRWTSLGQLTAIQRYNSSGSLASSWIYEVSSDANYSDASFIRLKNLSLSYQFVGSAFIRAHLDDFQIYVQGENLLTFTKYLGMDPETQSTAALPPLRMLTLGLKAGIK